MKQSAGTQSNTSGAPQYTGTVPEKKQSNNFSVIQPRSTLFSKHSAKRYCASVTD